MSTLAWRGSDREGGISRRSVFGPKETDGAEVPTYWLDWVMGRQAMPQEDGRFLSKCPNPA